MATLIRGRVAGAEAGAHPRIARRRLRVERARRRRNRPLLLLVVLTIGAIAAILVAVSPFADVDRVIVVGATHTGDDAITAASRIHAGDALVTVDPAAAARRIESLPWIASATVDRRFSGEIRISVIERVPVATVGHGVRRLLVDRDGHVLGEAVGDERLPSIGSVRPSDVVGSRLRDSQALLAGVATAIPAGASDTVLAMRSTGGEISILRTDGIVVRLGDETEIRTKIDAVGAALAAYRPGEVLAVDVRVPNAVAVTTTLPTGT